MGLLIFILLLFIILILYTQTSLSGSFWINATGAVLIGLFLTGLLSPILFISIAVLFALITVTLTYAPVRKKLITKPLFAISQKTMPPISETERDAIEAGTIWWEAELFKGNPDFTAFRQLPSAKLSKQEQAFLDGPVETLCEMMNDWEITHENDCLPKNIWDYIKKERFLGMIIPESYGGLGFSALAHSEVVMKLASRCVSGAVSVMVPNSLGPAELLLHFGTDKQKDRYLSRLAVGKEIPCFALTGPYAGSDAGAMPDYGVVCKGKFKGKNVLGFRLNWEKRYITLGPVATLLGLAFKAYDPDHLLGDDDELGITCALIPTDTKGVEIGDRHYPLNAVFQNGPNYGKDVFIPMEMIIGGQEQIGNGWRMLMESLSAGRGISLPSLGVAAGKFSARLTGSYSRLRKQFNIPIGQFEGVEEALARIGGKTYVMNAARLLTMVSLDSGEKPSVITAIQKYNLTEMMRGIVNDAMDVHGGKGICMGPSNYLARTYQSIPISITVEGANILTRSLMIFGQGAMRCHPYLLKELEALNNPDKSQGLDDFDTLLAEHIGYTTGNKIRTFVYAISNGKLAPKAGSPGLDHYYQQLSRWSAAFSFLADLTLMVLGGKFKRKEKLSGRFADALSHLYMGAATLKLYEDQGSNEDDLVYVDWGMQYCLYHIQEAIDGIITEFPSRAIGWGTKLLVFPFGRRQKMPSDFAGHKVANSLLEPSASRDRLTQGAYYNLDPDDPTGKVESAYAKVFASEPIEKRLKKAGHRQHYSQTFEAWVSDLLKNKLVSSEEAAILTDTHAAIYAAISVDSFKQKVTKQKAKKQKAIKEKARKPTKKKQSARQ